MQIKDMDLYLCVCKPMSEWERGLKGRPPTVGNLLSLYLYPHLQNLQLYPLINC